VAGPPRVHEQCTRGDAAMRSDATLKAKSAFCERCFTRGAVRSLVVNAGAREELSMMPACAHAFHAECIETWLKDKATCPVCMRDVKEDLKRS